jgi:hypothetical protein
MIDMFLPHILNSKAIDNQREGDRVGEMPPQTRCMFTLVISMGEESFAEEFIRQDTCLGEAPNSAAQFNVYEPVFCVFLQVVLFSCPGWEQGERHFYVLESIKWGHQIKILDVKAHEFCAFGAEDAVPHQF